MWKDEILEEIYKYREEHAKRMFEKYWANRIRYYTSKVHLRGLMEN
jgi:hypothetical protein